MLPALEALAALTITQIALRFCRFQSIRRVLLGAAGVCHVHRPLGSDTLLWAMRVAKKRCPIGTTCLGEALVGEAMLRQFGFHPTLCIGAARRDGKFEAHAWLEQNDAVILGGPAEIVQRYTRFPEIASLTL